MQMVFFLKIRNLLLATGSLQQLFNEANDTCQP